MHAKAWIDYLTIMKLNKKPVVVPEYLWRLPTSACSSLKMLICSDVLKKQGGENLMKVKNVMNFNHTSPINVEK